MGLIKGPLLAADRYDRQEKPVVVVPGQVWAHVWNLECRPLVVLVFEQRPGCSTGTYDRVVEWAIFRRGKSCMVDSLLKESGWLFLGELADFTQRGSAHV
jgi:hypothetical protein